MFQYPSGRLFVWAHRGSSSVEPENTLAAFLRAERDGADGIECDCQLTRDGVVVLMHDARLDRTTDQHGWVGDRTWAELQEVRISPPGGQGAPHRVPRLEEVLEALAPTTAVNLEIKNGPRYYVGLVGRVVEIVRRYSAQERVLLSSFDHYALQEAARLAPEMARAALYAARLTIPAAVAASVASDMVHLDAAYVTAQDMAVLGECGLKAGVYGIRDWDQWRTVAALAPQAVFLDDPRWAREAR